MKVGTDGVLLGAWAEGGSRILDVGTGTGLIALMMAQRFAGAQVVGLDIVHEACVQASANVAASPFAGRVSVVESAVQQYEVPERFDSIVSNPAFFVNSLRPSCLGPPFVCLALCRTFRFSPPSSRSLRCFQCHHSGRMFAGVCKRSLSFRLLAHTPLCREDHCPQARPSLSSRFPAAEWGGVLLLGRSVAEPRRKSHGMVRIAHARLLCEMTFLFLFRDCNSLVFNGVFPCFKTSLLCT